MQTQSTPAVPARQHPLLAFALALLCVCFAACSSPTYSLERFQNYSYGAKEAGRELSKGRFVEVSQPNMVSDNQLSFTGSKPPRQLRQDITFTQYLHTKYKIKSLVLPKASYDFISG